MYEYWCDERLNATTEGATRLGCPGLCGGLEHRKIEKIEYHQRNLNFQAISVSTGTNHRTETVSEGVLFFSYFLLKL